MSPQIVLGSSLPRLGCTWSRCSRLLAVRSRRWTPSLCWEWTPDQVEPIRFVEEKLVEREESNITEKEGICWKSASSWHLRLPLDHLQGWLTSLAYLIIQLSLISVGQWPGHLTSNFFTRDYNIVVRILTSFGTRGRTLTATLTGITLSPILFPQDTSGKISDE